MYCTYVVVELTILIRNIFAAYNSGLLQTRYEIIAELALA